MGWLYEVGAYGAAAEFCERFSWSCANREFDLYEYRLIILNLTCEAYFLA